MAGAADFVGFGDDGVYVAINNGNGTVKVAAEPVLKAFGYDQGWCVGRDIRIIADITGNGVGDIVGFGEHGVYVSRNRRRGAFDPAKLVMRDFGYLQGWRVEKHPRFVVDVTGNGCADIVGFGEKATYVALNDRHGNFAPAQKLSEEFSWNKGWDPSKSVRYVLPRVWDHLQSRHRMSPPLADPTPLPHSPHSSHAAGASQFTNSSPTTSKLNCKASSWLP